MLDDRRFIEIDSKLLKLCKPRSNQCVHFTGGLSGKEDNGLEYVIVEDRDMESTNIEILGDFTEGIFDPFPIRIE
jgi:hypothetical protein